MKLAGRSLLPLGRALLLGEGLSGTPLLGDGDTNLPNLTSGLFGVPGDVVIEGQGIGARIYSREAARFGASTGSSGSATTGPITSGSGPFDPNPNPGRRRPAQ